MLLATLLSPISIPSSNPTPLIPSLCPASWQPPSPAPAALPLQLSLLMREAKGDPGSLLQELAASASGAYCPRGTTSPP
jgi:hypothetical protein